MAFIERMGDALLNMGKDVSQKAKDVSGIAKLKLNIRSKEDFIRDLYIELGKAYYEKYQGEDVPEQIQFAQIDEAMEAIAQMEQQILELKGAKKCPGCGAEASDSAEYCCVCGAKLTLEAECVPEDEKDAGMDFQFEEADVKEPDTEAGADTEG